MSMEREISGSLKSYAKRIKLPSTLNSRIESMIDNSFLDHRQHSFVRRWRKKLSIAVGSLCLVVIGMVVTGFTSPNTAATLGHVPIIGAVFNLLTRVEFSGSRTLQFEAEQGYSQSVNQSITDQGIKLTIGNVVCDGHKLGIEVGAEATDFSVWGQLKRNNSKFVEVDAKVNGMEIGDNLNEIAPKLIDGNRYATVWEFYPENPAFINPATDQNIFPSQFTLNLHVNSIGGIKGDWNFTFPVRSHHVANLIREYNPNFTKTNEGLSFTINKISIDPDYTSIDYTPPFLSNDSQNIWLAVYEDKGNRLDQGTADGTPQPNLLKLSAQNFMQDFKHWTAVVHSPPEVSKYLRIVPFYMSWYVGINEDDFGNTKVFNKKELLGTDHEMTITKFERLPDKSLVYISTDHNDFQQADPYHLRFYGNGNGSGETLSPVSVRVVDSQKHETVIEFPPLKDKYHYTLQSDVHQPRVDFFINSLEFKIPLTK